MTETSLLQNPVLQPTPSFVEHRVPRDGSSLYLREYRGAGPAFVLMHGFPDNLHIYDRLIPILVAAGRHVVTFDFLGFGASDKPAGYSYSYSFEQQLGDLEAVVEFLKLSQIVPVGHDAGGIAAIDYVLSNPQRVSRLCLLNTFYGDAPTLRLPELVELFAVPDLRALAIAIATDPKQMAFLLTFQQSRFKIDASQAQIETVESVLAPLINDNFAQQPSAGPCLRRACHKRPCADTAQQQASATVERTHFSEHDYLGQGRRIPRHRCRRRSHGTYQGSVIACPGRWALATARPSRRSRTLSSRRSLIAS